MNFMKKHLLSFLTFCCFFSTNIFSQDNTVGLLSYNPDLIIGNVFFIDRAGYGRLSDIAPTVAVRIDDPLLAYVETLTIFGLRGQAETGPGPKDPSP